MLSLLLGGLDLAGGGGALAEAGEERRTRVSSLYGICKRVTCTHPFLNLRLTSYRSPEPSAEGSRLYAPLIVISTELTLRWDILPVPVVFRRLAFCPHSTVNGVQSNTVSAPSQARP